ncbi:hypothetical protein BGX23_004221 [Mortierella sp. AD031]|nr:hypothetical protein BGX23_004221 [Mortierella sp. AD031]KAG0219282.1 hypothetical protein BGX33_003829 [Mortierella sp. NVP41]
MRLRLTFEDPLPPYKCWYEVPSSCSTIRDLQKAVRKGFNLDHYCKTTRLDLDGFFLLPASTIAGSLKDGDLLQVMIRRKGDSLPPRHLPVSGGRKRSSEDAGFSRHTDRYAMKKVKSIPKKPATPAKPGSSTKQDSQQKQPAQGQKQSNVQKKNNNKTQQNNQPSTPNVKGNATKAQNNNSNTATKSKNAATTGIKGQKTSNTTTAAPSPSGTKGARAAFQSKARVQQKDAPTVLSSSDSDSSDSSSSSSSSSSNSDSSDGSDSDSSSDSDSNSDSDSSSDSYSSNSTSGSSNKNNAKAAPTRAPPGMGTPSTKSRNARRKLTKQRLAGATTEPGTGTGTGAVVSKTADTSIHEKHTTSTPHNAKAPITTAADPAPRANGKAPSQANKKVPAQANGKATVQAPAPKVFMTSIELKDSELMSRATSKRVTRSSQKKPNGASSQDVPAPQPETASKQQESGNNAATATAQETEDSAAVDATPRDYDALPKSDDNLNVGDVIAFKTLEMGPSYTPIISDFKEATVLSFSSADTTAEVQLARKFRSPVPLDNDGNPILGKFDIYDEEEIERTRRGIVSLDILGLADCRIVSRK